MRHLKGCLRGSPSSRKWVTCGLIGEGDIQRSTAAGGLSGEVSYWRSTYRYVCLRELFACRVALIIGVVYPCVGIYVHRLIAGVIKGYIERYGLGLVYDDGT